jgi:hypothetical protein
MKTLHWAGAATFLSTILGWACSETQVSFPNVDASLDVAPPTDAPPTMLDAPDALLPNIPDAATDAASNSDTGGDASGLDAQAESGAPYDAEAELSVPAIDAGPARATSAALTVDLGLVQAGEVKSFNVPPNTLGFTVTAKATQPVQAFKIASVIGPSGRAAMADGKPGRAKVPNGEAWAGISASVAIPQTFVDVQNAPNPDVMAGPSGLGVAVGTWSVKVPNVATQMQVSFQTTADGAYHGGLLDTVFYIPNDVVLPGSEGPLDAQVAVTSPYFNRFVDAFYRALAYYYGLERGNIRFIPIESTYGELSDLKLLSGVRKTSLAAPEPHVLIGRFGSQAWLGISPGVPGSANVLGGAQSAVALAFSAGFGPNMNAFILAHEYGHFAGPNHTSEYQPGLNDPLDDTPECSIYRASDIDLCASRTNIMFPQAPPRTPVAFTPLQYRVITGSTAYRAYQLGSPLGRVPSVAPATMPAVFAPEATWASALFGKAREQDLTAAETLVAMHTCGNAPLPTLSSAMQSDLRNLAATALTPVARNIAKRLAYARQ